MNPIKKLPDLDWDDIAKREIIVTGENLVEQSDYAYQIGRVAIAGLIYYSYTSAPWFWFALAKGVTIRDLIDFRRLQEEIPIGSMTAVRTDRVEALRFARFYGFEETGELRTLGNTTYKLFRRA
jgi:hypothetical protein